MRGGDPLRDGRATGRSGPGRHAPPLPARTGARLHLNQLDVLYEVAGLPGYRIPAALRDIYGGDLGFDSPCLYGNFVSSLDGVVALEDASTASIAGQDGRDPDRFVMGLLRACADTVLIGAGTLRAEPRHIWTPGSIYPGAADLYGALRRQLGRPLDPPLIVVSASGEIDSGLSVLERGALIITTAAGRSRLEGRLPKASRILSLPETGSLDLAAVLRAVRDEGHRVVLTEGGPRLLGGLLKQRLLSQLFLTLSPLIGGRDSEHRRPGLAEGAVLLPDEVLSGRLLSARRSGSHLFLRYAMSD